MKERVKKSVDSSVSCSMLEIKNIHGAQDLVIEQYCRCTDGSFGFDCDNIEFGNPCDGDTQFYSSPPSVSDRYYVQCAHLLPNLFKCPGFLEWNDMILTCAGSSGKKSYGYDNNPYARNGIITGKHTEKFGTAINKCIK